MKRIIYILALLVTITTANSQTATFSFGSKDNTICEKETNYTITNTTATWFLFQGAKDYSCTQDFQCKLDSLAGNHTNIAVSLYGRKFSSDSWTQIGSTYNSTANSEVITISNTVHNRYREYKVLFQGTGTGTTTIDYQYLKVWLE